MEDPRGKQQRRVPRESRTIPLRGYGDDSGVFFRCWYCGFVNKVGRSELGGRDSDPGTVYSESSVINARGATPGDELSALIVARDMDTVVLLQSDSDGVGIPPVRTYDIGGTGCSLCHSKNWRGDY